MARELLINPTGDCGDTSGKGYLSACCERLSALGLKSSWARCNRSATVGKSTVSLHPEQISQETTVTGQVATDAPLARAIASQSALWEASILSLKLVQFILCSVPCVPSAAKLAFVKVM